MPDAASTVGRHRGDRPLLARLYDRVQAPVTQFVTEDAASGAELGGQGTQSTRLDLLTYPTMVLGGVLVMLAFALSRDGRTGALPLYWFGQIVLVTPCVAGCVRRTWSTSDRLIALQLLSAMQSLIAWAYSPDQFRFPDELQHVRTAHDIVATGHLFTTNSALPVSAGFPGLEVVTTALAHLAGISIFAAGVVTTSVAHVLLVSAVFLLARASGFGPRVAATIGLVYGFAPDYGYFDTLFTYTAIALPFFVLTLRAVALSLRGRDVLWMAMPPLFVAIVSHHLTGYVTCLVLFGLAIVMVRLRETVVGIRLLTLTAIGTAMAVGWTLAFAPSALDYLATPTKVALNAIFSIHASGAGQAAVQGEAPPLWQRLIGLAGTALILGAAIAGGVLLWRSRAPRAFRWLGLGAALYPAVIVVRLVVADGAEVATRLLAYAMLFVAVPVAVVLVRLWGVGHSKRGVALSLVAGVTMAIGAEFVGTPPSYERLPGRFYVAAYESGVDSQVAAAASFAARTFPPGSVVACDLMSCSLVAGTADVTATSAASPMFYAKNLVVRHSEITKLRLDYIIVDDRIAQQRPRAGTYFPGAGPPAGQSRAYYPGSLLTEFYTDPALSLVYDNGDVQIYDATRVWNE